MPPFLHLVAPGESADVEHDYWLVWAESGEYQALGLTADDFACLVDAYSLLVRVASQAGVRRVVGRPAHELLALQARLQQAQISAWLAQGEREESVG